MMFVKKKIWFYLSMILLASNIGMLYFFLIKGNTTVSKSDSRIAILAKPQDRDFVLSEMRGFLESIQNINEGITENNPQKIIRAAKSSGMGIQEQVPPSLLRALPISFKKLGFNTHDKFDALAKAVSENYQKEQVQEQVNGILNNCTTCHKTYKIEAIK